MNQLLSRPATRLAGFAAALLSLGLVVPEAQARPGIPANLDDNLARLVRQFQERGFIDRTRPMFGPVPFDLAVFDRRERVLVDIYLDGRRSLADVHSALLRLRNVEIVAETSRYKAGVIEAYVPLLAAPVAARLPGVASVILSHKPVADVGLTTSQGVVQHKVDQLPSQINGAGITIAAISDSYNFLTTGVTAAQDVLSGDLPGPGNPNGFTQPVVVIQDSGSSDEGRAMLQIIHDMAPAAKLCFATANGGQVNFANNIRALADPNLPCDADVIVDDIIYLAEPFFTDGIVAQAVDDVVNGTSFPTKRIAYFSSAGNRPGTQAYFSDLRLVPGNASSLAGTNLNLTGVDPALYAGGFHNFNPAGLDIAQNVAITSSGTIVFQWDDPYDVSPVTIGNTLFSASGTLSDASPTADFPFNGTAGQQISIFVDANPANGNPNPDLTVEVLDASGRRVGFADDGTNPEQLVLFLPATGQYTIRVAGFQGADGDFVITVSEAFGTQRVTSDFNLLFFNAAGTFLFSAATNNLATNQPIEISGVSGTGTVQLVIARANTPAATPAPASKLRYVWFTSGSPREYYSYTSPVTYGHNSARGANGVAAYSPFQPNIPEDFTSPGPATIYFDTANNRLPTPEVRLKPDMAATDGVNNTFFSADTNRDLDTFPNFFGTSAAAPHAAAVAALVLQAAGGRASLTPTQVRSVLQTSALPHDLDPYFARGVATVAGTRVTITASGDNSFTGQIDPNFFRVAVTGSGSVTSLVFNASGGNVTGGNVVSGQGATPGLVFDTRPTNATLGGGFPFTLGTLQGISSTSISSQLSNPAPAPSLTGMFTTLTVSIAPGALTGGRAFGFGIDRDEARSAFAPPTGDSRNGGSADLLGVNVFIPSGTIPTGGVTFSGTLGSGAAFNGIFVNRIGAGYSLLDGFGHIDAKRAVESVQAP